MDRQTYAGQKVISSVAQKKEFNNLGDFEDYKLQKNHYESK